MTNETERRVAKRAARAMRTAALRLALERAGQESEAAYGCVDWFRYDTPSQSQEADTPVCSRPRATGCPMAEASDSVMRNPEPRPYVRQYDPICRS